MKEVKDPEIKLFGKKIALPESGRIVPVVTGEVSPGNSVADDKDNSSGSNSERSLDRKKMSRVEESESEDGKDKEKPETDKDDLSDGTSETKPQGKDQDPISEESQNPEVLSQFEDNPSTPSMDEDPPMKQSPDTENDQSDAANSQQKTVKKPDKILPCPRCNSMDTKFCYYNNYNVNQPRHFCKSCQRYWTSGGTMRNVPVGAGRRKSKNSASHCRHIAFSEALHAAQIDTTPIGFHHTTFKPNCTVLSFGTDLPLCDSVASVLNLTENNVPNCSIQGSYKLDPGISNSGKRAENIRDDCSSGSSVTTSNSLVEVGKNVLQEPYLRSINGFPPPVPCIPGVPWPFPWNSAVPLPPICPPGFAMPFYPAPFWNCNVPGVWNVPWLPPVSPNASHKSLISSPSSPALGKHSREGELLKPKSPEGKESLEQKNIEKSILVPKTLRVGDPDEAAKSSIWATLGIKYDSVSRGGLFKALQPKGDEKKPLATTSALLQANPAALSRSVTFQEGI